MGPHPIPVAVLKDMSCLTGGKLTTIMTSSGVRTKIQVSIFFFIFRCCLCEHFIKLPENCIYAMGMRDLSSERQLV